VLAIILFAIGGIVALVGLVGQGALQSPRAEIPHALQFDIVAGQYSIFVDTEGAQGGPDVNATQAVMCDIDNAGTAIQVLGSSQTLGNAETPLGELIGDFTAKAGPTTVTCDLAGHPESSGYEYVVAPAAQISVGTIVFLVLGGLALVGSGLNWLAWARRRPR
jgi:hypothetical protein